MQNEVEQALAEGLRHYASAEPLAGLEQRVLERIRAEQTRRRFARLGWWPGALAAALASAGLIAGLWMRGAPQALTIRWASPQPPRITAIAQVHPRSARHAGRLRLRRQFPTPTPLTAEERALLAFVAQSPAEARDFVERTDEPIRVETIRIPPLEYGNSK